MLVYFDTLAVFITLFRTLLGVGISTGYFENCYFEMIYTQDFYHWADEELQFDIDSYEQYDNYIDLSSDEYNIDSIFHSWETSDDNGTVRRYDCAWQLQFYDYSNRDYIKLFSYRLLGGRPITGDRSPWFDSTTSLYNPSNFELSYNIYFDCDNGTTQWRNYITEIGFDSYDDSRYDLTGNFFENNNLDTYYQHGNYVNTGKYIDYEQHFVFHDGATNNDYYIDESNYLILFTFLDTMSSPNITCKVHFNFTFYYENLSNSILHYINNYSTPDDFNEGYKSGYAIGSKVGYDNGFGDGRSSGYSEGLNVGYDGGYQNGYNAGYNEASSNSYTFLNLFGAIADTPIMIVRNLLGFEVFGVEAINILMTMITGCIAIYLIRKFI